MIDAIARVRELELELDIENLAYDESVLRAYVRELETDIVVYRELAQLALGEFATATRRIQSLRQQLHALRAERGTHGGGEPEPSDPETAA